MKDKLWPFQQMQVPHCNNAVGFVGRGGILVVGRNAEFWVLFMNKSVSGMEIESATCKQLLWVTSRHQ
jgi:hypothetical protein